MNINEAFQLAREHHLAGNFDQAEYLYKEILKVQPNNIGGYYDLGNVFRDKGRLDEAISCYQKAIKLDPNYAGSYFNLGNIFINKGRLDEAINCYLKLLQLKPDFIDGYNILGNILLEKGQFDEAISCYLKLLQLKPDFVEIYNNLGIAFRNNWQFDEAINCYLNVLAVKPDFTEAYYNLGNILLEKGQFDEAINCYQKVVQIKPDFVQAYNNLGIAFKNTWQIDEAISCYQRALDINPSFAETYTNLGDTLYEEGKNQEAIDAYDKAISFKPNNIKARWAKCFAQLPIAYPDQSLIEISRNNYKNELKKFQDTILLTSLENIEGTAEAIGIYKPVYLAYQDFNDLELQQIYGNLVCRIMALRYPQFANRPIMPSCLSGEPLRVGIASGHFFFHTVWKLFKGWFENIDRRKFILYGYYTGKKADKETEIARKYFNRFVENIYSFEKLCQMIREDNLHVLIYPEIGMDPTILRLAALRLAPIQCASWGHPETSGLPTIDYFLSSDLMEPPDAFNSYTERLIRLPNLSIHYTPFDVPNTSVNRETFGLHIKSILYLCCQSLFKYLPQYDEIYPRIAQEINNCKFVFINHPTTWITEQFQFRLNQAFKNFNLNAKDYIIFLPRLNQEQYYEINRLSDIYLDSIGWSGGNTTLEAIACNLPVITIPSELMRGRHSSAILTMMGVTETIASTLDEYIEIAVRLGLDSEWRKQISEKIAVNKHFVYHDKTCITALEDFLERVVKKLS